MMIVFDLDGTLYRTHETCLPPLKDICKAHNLSITDEDINLLLYTTTHTFLNRVAPDMPKTERTQFEEEFKYAEIAYVKEHGRLFDGAYEMLNTLYNSGVIMSICGMGEREYIEAILDRCNIRKFFSYVYYHIEGRDKNTALAQLLCEAAITKNDCIMVGDSIVDITAARANSVPFIGVTYGYGSKDISLADILVKDCYELKQTLCKALIF